MKPKQQGLFKYTLKQLCRDARCSVQDLEILKQNRLLSFPINKEKYDDSELYEAIFLTSLLKSELSIEKINKMLSGLEKPYSYSNIYYNFITQKWVQNPIREDEIENYIVENSDLISDHIDEYLETLYENDDQEKLKEIIKSAAGYLE